jgi:hypothetical protein
MIPVGTVLSGTSNLLPTLLPPTLAATQNLINAPKHGQSSPLPEKTILRNERALAASLQRNAATVLAQPSAPSIGATRPTFSLQEASATRTLREPVTENRQAPLSETNKLTASIKETFGKFGDIDAAEKRERFNSLMALQGALDYCLSLAVGGEGRRQQRLDADEAAGDPFLNPDAEIDEDNLSFRQMAVNKVLSLIGSAVTFAFGPDDHAAFMQDEAQQETYNTRGNILYSIEGAMRTVSGYFFSPILKGTMGDMKSMLAELTSEEVDPKQAAKYLDRLNAFAQTELAQQKGEIGIVRYFTQYLLFKALTKFRPRQYSLAQRAVQGVQNKISGAFTKVTNIFKRSKKKENVFQRLKDPSQYLTDQELAFWQEAQTPGNNINWKQKLALKLLALFGVNKEERTQHVKDRNGSRSNHKANGKFSALAMGPLEATIGPAAGAAAYAFMHYSDVHVANAATRAYPIQIAEIYAAGRDKETSGLLRLLWKGSGSEVGKGLFAAYSLAMGSYMLYALVTGDADVTSMSQVFDELAQARKSMPKAAQIPITGMFVAGATLMLGTTDLPGLLTAYKTLAVNTATGKLKSSTPEELGDMAYAASTTLGTAASLTSMAGFFFMSQTIGQALGYYLCSAAAGMDYGQTRFSRMILKRAAKKAGIE